LLAYFASSASSFLPNSEVSGTTLTPTRATSLRAGLPAIYILLGSRARRWKRHPRRPRLFRGLRLLAPQTGQKRIWNRPLLVLLGLHARTRIRREGLHLLRLIRIHPHQNESVQIDGVIQVRQQIRVAVPSDILGPAP